MINMPSWEPSSSIINLRKRSIIISQIRKFFAKKNILEVETPMLSRVTNTDLYSVPFKTSFINSNQDLSRHTNNNMWLITSPEHHMKRLLAAGSGPIYQICHSFRNGEIGNFHNPEFTILEWYRPFFDIYELMHEVYSLLKLILKCDEYELFSYQELFIKYLQIDPLSTNKDQLYKTAKNFPEFPLVCQKDSYDEMLQLLFVLGIEPYIGLHKPTFVYHFPSNQSALAKINKKDPRIAERFEVYYQGIELGNGFDELLDSQEQKKRFENDNNHRLQCGLPIYDIDHNLLDALSYGMPQCSGVAIGIDRLMMLALKVNSIKEVISFSIDRS